MNSRNYGIWTNRNNELLNRKTIDYGDYGAVETMTVVVIAVTIRAPAIIA